MLTLSYNRRGADWGGYSGALSRQQWSGVRHLGPAWPAVLPNIAHGACGQARWLMEAVGFRYMGT